MENKTPKEKHVAALIGAVDRLCRHYTKESGEWDLISYIQYLIHKYEESDLCQE
jgi:hypothetical protein